ncbi:ribonuclease HI [Patescibacteria group bacterium]|nr:ribonuclease HI [Patescibacteria group bacterium]
MNKTVTIFTDGAAKGNPGRGGYGVVISDGETITELGGHKARTTNNEMELKAVVEALTFMSGKTNAASIYTDSKYVVEGATGWIFGWMNNGWQTKAKTDVINKELWQDLAKLLKQVTVDWHKVPGHVGIIGNERADVIASTFASAGTFELYAGPKSTYGHAIENTQYDESKAKDRSDARKRSAQKAYSYVSAVDGVVKIHQTWAECEARVKGKSGVRFKKSLDAGNEREIVKEFGG